MVTAAIVQADESQQRQGQEKISLGKTQVRSFWDQPGAYPKFIYRGKAVRFLLRNTTQDQLVLTMDVGPLWICDDCIFEFQSFFDRPISRSVAAKRPQIGFAIER